MDLKKIQSEGELYQRLKLLGEGAFGKAYLVKQKSTGNLYVIKQMNISEMSITEQQQTLKEAKIIQILNHPNIVKFKEVYLTTAKKLNIVMEYADGGDLSRKITDTKKTGKLFDETSILDWFTQICLAIKHVHDRKIIHRDIKGQNIFITKNNIVKLGDFGIARVLNKTMDKARTVVGTPYYLSPEIIENKPYSFKSDIWSMGVLLYELCALAPPFTANSLQFLALKIVKGSYNQLQGNYSKELKSLIAQMLMIDPAKRPTVTEILKKPFIVSRIQHYLTQTQNHVEFSHTVIHNFKFGLKPPQANIEQERAKIEAARLKLKQQQKIHEKLRQQKRQQEQKKKLQQKKIAQERKLEEMKRMAQKRQNDRIEAERRDIQKRQLQKKYLQDKRILQQKRRQQQKRLQQQKRIRFEKQLDQQKRQRQERRLNQQRIRQQQQLKKKKYLQFAREQYLRNQQIKKRAEYKAKIEINQPKYKNYESPSVNKNNSQNIKNQQKLKNQQQQKKKYLQFARQQYRRNQEIKKNAEMKAKMQMEQPQQINRYQIQQANKNEKQLQKPKQQQEKRKYLQFAKQQYQRNQQIRKKAQMRAKLEMNQPDVKNEVAQIKKNNQSKQKFNKNLKQQQQKQKKYIQFNREQYFKNQQIRRNAQKRANLEINMQKQPHKNINKSEIQQKNAKNFYQKDPGADQQSLINVFMNPNFQKKQQQKQNNKIVKQSPHQLIKQNPPEFIIHKPKPVMQSQYQGTAQQLVKKTGNQRSNSVQQEMRQEIMKQDKQSDLKKKIQEGRLKMKQDKQKFQQSTEADQGKQIIIKAGRWQDNKNANQQKKLQIKNQQIIKAFNQPATDLKTIHANKWNNRKAPQSAKVRIENDQIKEMQKQNILLEKLIQKQAQEQREKQSEFLNMINELKKIVQNVNEKVEGLPEINEIQIDMSNQRKDDQIQPQRTSSFKQLPNFINQNVNLEYFSDYSKLESLRITLQDVFGTDDFIRAYRIIEKQFDNFGMGCLDIQKLQKLVDFIPQQKFQQYITLLMTLIVMQNKVNQGY